MLQTTELNRIFKCKIDGQPLSLPDPNPTWSAETVLNFYSHTYPILTAAKVDGPEIVNDNVEYVFATTLGTKG